MSGVKSASRESFAQGARRASLGAMRRASTVMIPNRKKEVPGKYHHFQDIRIRIDRHGQIVPDNKESASHDGAGRLSNASDAGDNERPRSATNWKQGTALLLRGRTQDVSMIVDVKERWKISWSEIPSLSGTGPPILEAGYVNLFEYPTVWHPSHDKPNSPSRWQPRLPLEEEEEATPRHSSVSVELPNRKVPSLAGLLEALVMQKKEVRKLHDCSGARLIHALLVANNDASLSLAERLLEHQPKLLLDVHANPKPSSPQAIFEGEGSLHILAANEQTELLCRLLKLARKSLGDDDFLKMLSQQAVGPFFEVCVWVCGVCVGASLAPLYRPQQVPPRASGHQLRV